MNNSTQQELLTILGELQEYCPDVRFGQLIANLATLARGPDIESIWDVDDDELLAAARQQLKTFRARRSETA